MIVDLVLGAIVFAGFMLAWWHERPQAVVSFYVDDELLDMLAKHTRRWEAAARSVGKASKEAAEAMLRFQDAYLESVRRGSARP